MPFFHCSTHTTTPITSCRRGLLFAEQKVKATLLPTNSPFRTPVALSRVPPAVGCCTKFAKSTRECSKALMTIKWSKNSSSSHPKPRRHRTLLLSSLNVLRAFYIYTSYVVTRVVVVEGICLSCAYGSTCTTEVNVTPLSVAFRLPSILKRPQSKIPKRLLVPFSFTPKVVTER